VVNLLYFSFSLTMEEQLLRLMANPFKIQTKYNLSPEVNAQYQLKCLLQKYTISEKYYSYLYSKIENILQEIQIKETLDSIIIHIIHESNNT
jgi:hypothetical protein